MLSGKIGEKRTKKKISNVICILFFGGTNEGRKKITQMHIIKSKQNQIQNEKNLLCV